MPPITKPQARTQPSQASSQPPKAPSQPSQATTQPLHAAATPQASPPIADSRAEEGGGRENEIRSIAYRKWQEAGCPASDGVEFWLAAETEILRRKKPR
ncbi:MAG TPA: DUF2934 domain-containing protein [Pirellulales bacterium]|jgi:hypothetical protein|nr:DUF2934 domain-containing protein [Pirellulales bacterium]